MKFSKMTKSEQTVTITKYIKDDAKKCKDILHKKIYNHSALNWKLSQ
jgi:hypothetical protein